MKTLWKIDAVHPVNKRVIKSNMPEQEMEALYKELLENGYEDRLIDVEICQYIYEDGDTIEIPPEIFDTLPDSVRELEYYTQQDVRLANIKETLKYIFGDHPKSMKAKVVTERVNRSFGHLILEWENANEGWEKTNISIVEPLGFKFEYPDFDEIPIDKATDDVLNDEELVIKHLMIQNGWNEETANGHLKPVFKAMNDAGIVFYKP